MKGFVKVPQFWYAAKKFSDLAAPAHGDAESFVKLFGPLRTDVVERQPAADFGSIVFRIEDDETLTLVGAQYDSSG